MVTPAPRGRPRDVEYARMVARRRALTDSFARLREEVASSAAAVAQIEEALAGTFELTARNVPRRAEQLLQKAKVAREYAALERARVRKYRDG